MSLSGLTPAATKKGGSERQFALIEKSIKLWDAVERVLTMFCFFALEAMLPEVNLPDDLFES
jgi:hypothetical protein